MYLTTCLCACPSLPPAPPCLLLLLASRPSLPPCHGRTETKGTPVLVKSTEAVVTPDGHRVGTRVKQSVYYPASAVSTVPSVT
jgi:hypothetical protein